MLSCKRNVIYSKGLPIEPRACVLYRTAVGMLTMQCMYIFVSLVGQQSTEAVDLCRLRCCEWAEEVI